MKNIFLNKKGLSMVEALVSIGIFSIVTVGFITMLTNQNKEVKAVSEILAIQDTQKTLATAMSDINLCNYMISQLSGNSSGTITFNADRLPVSFELNTPIYSGIRLVSGSAPILGPVLIEKDNSPSALSPSLVVESIRFEILSGTIDNYIGRWTVDFDKTKTVRVHKPAYSTTLIKVDDADRNAAIVTGCNGIVDSKLSDKTCPTGQVLSGFTADGEISCFNPFSGGDCASGSVVVGVNSNGTVNCRQAINGGSCSPGDYVSGISADGSPLCETLAQSSSDCIGAFDTCSATCGGGTQTFRISRPKVGTGADCSFADGYSQACNPQACTRTSTGTSTVCVDHVIEYQFRKNGSNLELLQWGRGRDNGAIGWNCGRAPARVVWSAPLNNPAATPQVSLVGTASGAGCYNSNLSFSGYAPYRANGVCPARGAQNISSSFTITYTD